MAKILINRTDLQVLIENYTKENNSFRILSSYQIKGNTNATTYNFILNGKQCRFDIYYKEKETKVIPVGKNIEQTNILIEYIKEHALNPNIETKQIIFPSNVDFCDKIKEYMLLYYPESVKVETNKNIYIFIGYNQDRVYIHQYKDKIMLQGKPLYVFGLIISYIAENTDIDLESFSNLMCTNLDVNVPFKAIRERMEILLSNAYSYIDEAIRKTLSSSIVMLEKHKDGFIEDYSGCLTGVFKTLEGYLKKVLKRKYHHQFNSNATFELFDKQNWCIKPGYIQCNESEERQLCELYKLFNNKRNVFLHSKINPATTSIISSYMEAESIFNEIVTAIKESYDVFFGD